jgi:hypothetical protein
MKEEKNASQSENETQCIQEAIAHSLILPAQASGLDLSLRAASTTVACPRRA